MQRPPPLNAAIYFPITTGIAALSIVATWRFHAGADVSLFMQGYDVWWIEILHFISTTFFHGNLLHLIFNLYWLWVFGTKVETEFGHAAMLGIFAFLAVGSSAAEYAFSVGGIGLSGVGYGLFGLLWVLSRSDPRFRDSIDRQTVYVLVGWFFLCIFLTVTNVWNIGNIAHGMGCVLGALLGWTLAERNRLRKMRNTAILGTVFLLSIAGGTVLRPYVNFYIDVGQHFAYQGYLALENGDNESAADLYERATAANPNVPDWWHNLGCAYQRLDQLDKAAEAFQHENELRPVPSDK